MSELKPSKQSLLRDEVRQLRAELARRDEIIARLKDAGNELYLKGCRNYLPLGDADWAWRALMKELEC